MALEDITTQWGFSSKREKMGFEMRGDKLRQIVNHLLE